MSTSQNISSTTISQTLSGEPPSSGLYPLIAYFRSGWAFLIPYLAAYLLYAWLKWPVNPVSGEGLEKGISESVEAVHSQLSTLSSPRSPVPCLLHVYWFLHGLHVILAAIALRAWWRNTQYSAPTSNAPLALHRMYAVIPWLGLAIIFWIPGTYLEWPADPWEHFRRITEWGTHSTAGSHSAGYKSFYFFAYSFLVNSNPLEQLARLNLYSTLISLLLAWQYYRLARTVGLDCRWAFISVLANVCLFGNVCFSFYRYYALASTMYSQLGAVALIRIVFETARSPELTLRSFLVFPKSGRSHGATISGLLFSSIPLLALIASNHVQGIGIASLGLASVVVWRILKGNASRIWWIAGGTLALSFATYLWWPRHPAVDTVYRPGGWLNAWYGLNFVWSSPSTDRAMQILGSIGMINLLAGIVLLRRNHIVGWLTLVPVVALALPFFALPFANSLAAKGVEEIVTFHRMLFAIPSGLALTCCLSEGWKRMRLLPLNSTLRSSGFVAVITVILTLVLLTPDYPSRNRLWNLLRTTPQDLNVTSILPTSILTRDQLYNTGDYRLVTTDAVAFIFNANSPALFPYRGYHINNPTAQSLFHDQASLSSSKPTTETPQPTLVRDPLASDSSAYISVGGGAAPKFTAKINDFRAGTTALENPAGSRSEILTADAIPVDSTKAYRLEVSLKQWIGTHGEASLAVAWYDADRYLLTSNTPRPNGAGFPGGWINGTYSYYGLINEIAPTKWMTYRISFGSNEIAQIPLNAKFVRIGALLNSQEVPNCVIQLTNIRLWEKSGSERIQDGIFHDYARYFVILPDPKKRFTPASQAGQLSHHWPAQELASNLAGSPELLGAAKSAGGQPIEANDSIIQLNAFSDQR